MMRKWEVWSTQRQQWRSAVTILTVLAVIVIMGGTSLAGTSEVLERASMDLASTGAIFGITGDADLRLLIRDQDESFRAGATAEGEELVEGDFFSLCVNDLFIDAAEAKELEEEEEFGGNSVKKEEATDEVGVDLGDELAEAPFPSLLGLTVTIREGVGCSGTIVMIGTVETIE